MPANSALETEAPARLRLATPPVPSTEIAALVTRKLADQRSAHLRFLRSRLRSREDAEDVLQDFSVKVLQAVGGLSNSAKVDAWLSVTLRNTLFDRYRRNAGRARLRDAVAAEPVVERQDDEELELPLACLKQGVADLRPEAAALLQRAELDETPLKQIADDLSITANNAGVRVHRARDALRTLMRERCSACAAQCALATRFLERAA